MIRSKPSLKVRTGVWTLFLGGCLSIFMLARPALPASAPILPAPSVDQPKAAGALQTAVLSGGCFWGVQGVFEHVRGVHRVLAGYAGGDKSTAHYSAVGTGRTGHAESVQITFDPQQVSYGDILQIFFSVAHDPTEVDRQGPDTGPQYRSEIFYANAEQKKIAEAYIAQLDRSKMFAKPIATHVDPLEGFYAAEDYHQDFLIKNPDYPYIVYNDLPKIAALKDRFPSEYQGQPAKLR